MANTTFQDYQDGKIFFPPQQLATEMKSIIILQLTQVKLKLVKNRYTICDAKSLSLSYKFLRSFK